MIITVSIFLLIVISIGTTIKIKINKMSQEQCITLSFFLIILFTYLLGILNLMKIAIYIIYVIAFFCSMIDLFYLCKRKIKIKQIITVPILIYIIICYVLALFLKNSYYYVYDEFSFWGTNLKFMFKENLLWASNSFDTVHQTYPPISGIIEYLFLKITNQYKESIAILSMSIATITTLLPIFKNTNYKIKEIGKTVVLFLVSILLIFAMNGKLNSILIDTLLGVLFFLGMYQTYGKENRLLIAVICIILPLMKNIGIIFSAIILLQLVANAIYLKIAKKQKIQKDILIILIIGIVMLGFYFGWVILCKNNQKTADERHDKNTVQNIDIKESYLLLTNQSENEELVTIWQNYKRNLLENSIFGKNPFLTTVSLWCISNILLIFSIIKSKNKSNVIITTIMLNIGFILYQFILLFTFLFVFVKAEGIAIAGYERYIFSYSFPMFFISLLLLMEKLKKQKYGIMVGIIFICLLSIDYKQVKEQITYSHNNYQIQDYFNSYDRAVINTYLKNNEKIYLIDQQSTSGIEFHTMRYLLSPRSTNLLYEWRIGAVRKEEIEDKCITKEDFIQIVLKENFEFVYIVSVDDYFMENCLDLIEEPRKKIEEIEKKIYQIKKYENGEIKLKLIEKL